MMALLFGIINNMLMAILERRRELGMLMAVGMNKQAFLMILLETLCWFCWWAYWYSTGDLSTRIMMHIGVDLTSKKKVSRNRCRALSIRKSFRNTILSSPSWWSTALMPLSCLVRALKLNPVEAIRGQ